MLLIRVLVPFVFLSTNALAQMTLPSVFPDMKSVNPAVISLRKLGHVRLSAEVQNIKKEQNVTELNGNPFVYDDKSTVTLNNINFFRGGKGNGLTTEFFADYTTGKKETELVSQDGTTSDYTTDTSAMFASYAFGGHRWGLELHYVGFNSSNDYTVNINGENQTGGIEQTTTLMGVRPGIIFGSPSLSFALFAEYDNLSSTLKSKDPNEKVSGGSPSTFVIAGFGIGTGSPNGLLEIGIETNPIYSEKDPQTQKKLPIPMKISLVAERRFSKLILGYKGMAFQGEFIDLNKLIQNQLVYATSGDDIRLEHVLNFSIGSSKGLSVGASASYSNTVGEEKSSIYAGSDKHDTKSTAMSVSARVGYTY